jgi:hypothetical protein
MEKLSALSRGLGALKHLRAFVVKNNDGTLVNILSDRLIAQILSL